MVYTEVYTTAMNEVQVEPVLAPTPEEILQAGRALAEVCDGAVEQDGAGYNGCDSPTAKSILRSPNPTVRQIRCLWNILRKYRKQLAARGVAYETLVPPPLPAAPAPGTKPTVFVPQKITVKLQWADTAHGRRIVISTSAYSPEVILQVGTKTSKRWFDKEGKNSAGIKNAWLIPDDIGHLDSLVELLQDIKPGVQVEQAEDLKAAMNAARESKKKAYAESRSESAELEIKTKLPLRPFQKAGVKWAADRGGRVLIADEPGLGKTLQALGFLTLHPEALPALVICPATLRGN